MGTKNASNQKDTAPKKASKANPELPQKVTILLTKNEDARKQKATKLKVVHNWKNREW